MDFNDYLDGTELIQKMIRDQRVEHEESGKWGEDESKTDEELEKMVDKVLELMDTNNNGIITFLEFKNAQEKDKEQKRSSLTPNIW